jgi:hypothetical protein
MKILLINPDSPNTFWSLKRDACYLEKSDDTALGLLTVAAMLPEKWENAS